MTKNRIAASILAIAIMGLAACTGKNEKFQTTPGGLEYMIIKGGKADNKAMMGDFIEAHVTVKFDDTVVFDSRKQNNGETIKVPIQPIQFKFAPENGFTMLSPGDSGVFRSPIDSLVKAGLPLQPWMKSRKFMVYNVKMVAIKTQKEAQAEREQKMSGQKTVDEGLLQEYFKKNNLNPTKTESGLYYTISKPGTGENIKSGQEATVDYTGKTLDGTLFDSNTDPKMGHVSPFTLKVGQGQVIKGWDEGLQLLKKGSVATFYIPSGLAYGEQAPKPEVGANAILIFDVNVKDVK